MKDFLQIYELTGPRFKLALERFQDGKPFDFKGITFYWASKHPCILEAWAASSYPLENVTASTAVADLQMAKKVWGEIKSKSIEFAEIVKDCELSLVLINDYGTGAAELCRLTDGQLIWAKGMNK